MKNIYFESQAEITLEKYIDWATHPLGRKAAKKLSRFRLLMSFIMVITAVIGIVCFLGESYFFARIYAVLFLIFVYKLTLEGRVLRKKSYKTAREGQNTDKWIRTVTFSNDIVITDANSSTAFNYNDYTMLTENKNHYLLWRSENYVLRIEKGSFITGDEADFPAFMRKKLGNNKVKVNG